MERHAAAEHVCRLLPLNSHAMGRQRSLRYAVEMPLFIQDAAARRRAMFTAQADAAIRSAVTASASADAAPPPD